MCEPFWLSMSIVTCPRWVEQDVKQCRAMYIVHSVISCCDNLKSQWKEQ